MIDLHIHVLPGVDDGPRSLEESVHMCRLARAAGCSALVVTPHQRRRWPNQEPSELERRLQEVRAAVADEKLELFLGAEIRVDSKLLDELERRDRSGLLPLAGSRYLLVEFDPSVGGHEHCIHELAVSGWVPILAHPELTAGLGEDLDLMNRLVSLGARAQVTAMSVCGGFGPRPRRVALDLLDAGLVHFLASDAHSPSWRPPGLEEAFREIASRWGEAAAEQLTSGNPKAVVENRLLDEPNPVLFDCVP